MTESLALSSERTPSLLEKDAVAVISPTSGRLVPLRTPAEVAATLILIDARVVCVGYRDAQLALK
jgi:hypothetical protein